MTLTGHVSCHQNMSAGNLGAMRSARASLGRGRGSGQHLCELWGALCSLVTVCISVQRYADGSTLASVISFLSSLLSQGVQQHAVSFTNTLANGLFVVLDYKTVCQIPYPLGL